MVWTLNFVSGINNNPFVLSNEEPSRHNFIILLKAASLGLTEQLFHVQTGGAWPVGPVAKGSQGTLEAMAIGTNEKGAWDT